MHTPEFAVARNERVISSSFVEEVAERLGNAGLDAEKLASWLASVEDESFWAAADKLQPAYTPAQLHYINAHYSEDAGASLAEYYAAHAKTIRALVGSKTAVEWFAGSTGAAGVALLLVLDEELDRIAILHRLATETNDVQHARALGMHPNLLLSGWPLLWVQRHLCWHKPDDTQKTASDKAGQRKADSSDRSLTHSDDRPSP
jgi:hypothetical protein